MRIAISGPGAARGGAQPGPYRAHPAQARGGDQCGRTIAVARSVMEKAAEPALSISVPLVVDARAAANWDDAH